MDNPATAADVVKRWRPLDDNETTVAETYLADAWRDVRRAIPDLVTRLDAATDTDLRDETVKVLVTAVLRVLKNLDGMRSESIDDYSYTRAAEAASGLLEVTEAELNKLRIPEGYLGQAHVVSLWG